MSEYQYYEFLAIDRPLTEAQTQELRACSSGADITRTSFTNVYNFGNFKGNPDRWIEKYFDAFVYTTNWGANRLMLRLPRARHARKPALMERLDKAQLGNDK